MVTDQTYTQFRFTKIKALISFRILFTASGKIADAKHTPTINIKLGMVTPMLRDDLKFFVFDIDWFYFLIKLNLCLFRQYYLFFF